MERDGSEEEEGGGVRKRKREKEKEKKEEEVEESATCDMQYELVLGRLPVGRQDDNSFHFSLKYTHHETLSW